VVVPAPDDLRPRLSTRLMQRAAMIGADAASSFRFTAESLDERFARVIGPLIVQLLAAGIRDGRIETGDGLLAELHHATRERGLRADRLFTLVYATERTVLDDLASDAEAGAASERWPLAAQFVRRAAYDVLAALAERARLDPGGALIVDPLTTVYSRAVFDAVLAKTVEQAGRHGDALSVILVDIDNMAGINAAHGYGVGDRILERAGVLIRGFFRRDDWVARHGGDSFAAAALAGDACATLAERLEFVDHRSGTPVRVTASAGLVHLRGTSGAAIDPERLIADAEQALARARQREGDRVARIDREPTAPRAHDDQDRSDTI
jgi:diguanylate cyclase (GGDEF)-like protein